VASATEIVGTPGLFEHLADASSDYVAGVRVAEIPRVRPGSWQADVSIIQLGVRIVSRPVHLLVDDHEVFSREVYETPYSVESHDNLSSLAVTALTRAMFSWTDGGAHSVRCSGNGKLAGSLSAPVPGNRRCGRGGGGAAGLRRRG
jgi:hypothetical protein